MRKISLILIFAVLLCLVCGCNMGKKELTRDDFEAALKDHMRAQADTLGEQLGIDDMDVEVKFRDYSCEDGQVVAVVEDFIVSPKLEEELTSYLLTPSVLKVLSAFSFNYEGLECEGYTVTCTSYDAKPRIMLHNGHACMFKEDGVYISDDYAIYCPGEPTANPEEPYVGMNAEMIDFTGIGPHTKTGYNTEKHLWDVNAQKHDCTLYYWIEDGSCKYIVRVQNDIGRVINVEKDPSGSYFGN